MKNEVVKIDPKINEVVQSSGLEASKAIKYAEPYAPLLEEITKIANIVKGLDKTNPEHVAIAKRASLDIGKICSQADKVKKSDKAELLIITRYLDGLFNTVNGAGRLTQNEAKEIVNYQEKLRLEQIEKTRKERWEQLQQYAAVEPTGLGEMDSTIFDNLLIGMKATHEAKLEAERKAEEERKEQEQKQKEYNERMSEFSPYSLFTEKSIQLGMDEKEYQKTLKEAKDSKAKHDKEQAELKAEKERFKKEQEKIQKRRDDAGEFLKGLGFKYTLDHSGVYWYHQGEEPILHYRKDRLYFETETDLEQFRQDVKQELKNKKQELEAELSKQKELEKEREEARQREAKLQAELEAKRQAELKAENERKEAERLAKLEAERLAKAPIKEKLNNWVNSFDIQGAPVSNEVTNEIEAKFTAFKKWAINQIEKI